MLKKPISLRQVRRIAIFFSLLLLAGGIGYWFGQYRLTVMPGDGFVPPVVEITSREQPSEYRSIDFSLFWQVWDELERTYIDPSAIDREKMVYGAISGMTSALGDPYTAFLPPQENRQTKENLLGSFYGVGIQIGYRNGQLAVIAPIKDMPGERAGIEAGDFILRITDVGKGVDRDTIGISLPEAVSLIRGDLRTAVTLQLFREGIEEPFEVTVVREEIVIPSVELAFLPVEGQEGLQVAHLTVNQFSERTFEEWNDSVAQILSRPSAVAGVVLDMRNNPGGLLSGSVDIAGEFLDDGTVVVQQGRGRSQTFRVEEPGRLSGIPVVVVVNGGSASASEIVAGALRDRLGVSLVGEKTFGKGTVQEARDLPGGAGLHVTTSKWVLPSGEEIGEEGLVPDVEVTLEEEEPSEGEEEEVDEQLNRAIEVLFGQ